MAKKKRGKPSRSKGSSSSSSTRPSKTTKTTTTATSPPMKKSSAKGNKKQEQLITTSKKNIFDWSAIICVIFALIIASLTFKPAPTIESTGEKEEQTTVYSKAEENKEEIRKGEEEVEQKNIQKLFVGERYEVLEVLPHQPSSSLFTQGLTYHNGKLYEGTGMHGKSGLYELNSTNGAILNTKALDSQYFGEGITFYHDSNNQPRIIQLTWQEKIGFIYNADTFEVVKTFEYETSTSEGWGITYNEDAKEFIVSDGSNVLHFWDRDTLQEKRRMNVFLPLVDEKGIAIPVKSGGSARRVSRINELEYYKGEILANIWYNDIIIAIDARTGIIGKVYDLKNLYTGRDKNVDCFNGISVSDVDGEFFVTGKLWPNMYRIRLLD